MPPAAGVSCCVLWEGGWVGLLCQLPGCRCLQIRLAVVVLPAYDTPGPQPLSPPLPAAHCRTARSRRCV